MSLTTCLTDYIGISGCTPTTEPDSGIYLDRFLQGVELKMIDQIATEQQSDWTGVWADVQQRAIKQFESDVRQAFNERYRIKSVSQSVDIGKITETVVPLPIRFTQFRGFTLEMNTDGGDYVGSNMSEIYIQELYLWRDFGGQTDIKIFDLDDNTLLFSKDTGTLVTGWNTVRVLQSFPSTRIFVSYYADSEQSEKLDLTKVKNAVNFTHNDDWGFNVDYSVVCCGVQINGALAQELTPTVITKSNETYGLSGIFGLVCKWDSFVCANLKTFETAFAYCLGIELMNERLYSSRLNEFTMFDREKSAELKQLYSVKYKGGILDDVTYDGMLTQSVLGVNIDKHDCCIECDSDVTFMDARL